MDMQERMYNHILQIVLSNENETYINHAIFQDLLHFQILLVQMKLLGPKFSGEATVLEGPFKGMILAYPLLEGCLLPKVTGTYEQELQPFIFSATKQNYTTFVDIGCADGYYAVGMARLMPKLQVKAYDTNVKAQEKCKLTAFLNGVLDRMTVHGELKGSEFENFKAGETLILCDIEGGEEELIDPIKYPALRGFDIIVEMHDHFRPHLSERLMDKFKDTHDIFFIESNPKKPNVPDSLKNLSEFDKMLLCFEMRNGSTPWAIMTVKKKKEGRV